MYVWELPKPNLTGAIEVLIGDPESPREIKSWAIEHCHSYIWMELVDVSDVSSSQHDIVCAYYFYDDKDALMFKLKWK